MADLEIEHSKRAPYFAEMQQIVNEEVPFMPLFAKSDVGVHKSNLMNWVDLGVGGLNPPTNMIAAMYFK